LTRATFTFSKRVHDDAVDHLAVGDGASLFLHDLDVVLIHLPHTGDLLGDRKDGLHGQVSHLLPVRADGLADHGGGCDFPQGRLVLWVDLFP
jgi:hypothetical protein